MYEEIVKLENISKSYSTNLLLEHINLNIKRGTSIALTGNNGSGKSTLLKIIGGLTNVTSGKVIYLKEIKVNYIPEHFPKLRLSAKQYIESMGKIENIPINELTSKYVKLFHDFHMDSMLDIDMRYLSKGSLQKVAVIQALLTKPDILLLDEPLSGQDIQSQKYFIHLINELKSQDVAIVMSCHEMFLVNQVSDIAYQINNRQLVCIDIDHLAIMDYDILCFENSHNLKVPEQLCGDIEKIEYLEMMIRIVVKRAKSNFILREMLSRGFQLRSMRGVEQ